MQYVSLPAPEQNEPTKQPQPNEHCISLISNILSHRKKTDSGIKHSFI